MITSKKILVIVILAFSLTLNVAFVAVTGYYKLGNQQSELPANDDEARSERQRMRGERMQDLNLTEEQKKQLREKGRHLRRNIVDHRRQTSRVQQRFIELLTDSETDEEELKAIVSELQEERAEIHQYMLEHLIELREVLDEEQLAAMAEMFISRYNRGINGRERGNKEDINE